MPYRYKEGMQQSSDNLMSLPASRFGMLEALGWMWDFRIPVLAHVGVGVVLLIEITKGVVDFAMLALVCTDYHMLARRSGQIWIVLTVKKQIAHCAMALRHLPVVDGDFRSFHLFPLW
jgi:hypothetical protein